MGTMIFLVVLDLHHYPTCVLRWKMWNQKSTTVWLSLLQIFGEVKKSFSMTLISRPRCSSIPMDCRKFSWECIFGTLVSNDMCKYPDRGLLLMLSLCTCGPMNQSIC